MCACISTIDSTLARTTFVVVLISRYPKNKLLNLKSTSTILNSFCGGVYQIRKKQVYMRIVLNSFNQELSKTSFTFGNREA